MFDSILRLVRPGKDDAPPTSTAIAEAIEVAQATLRGLAAEADALRARRVDLVLEGDDGALDALERDVQANARRIEQAEALLVGLEDRLAVAREREAQTSVDGFVAEARALRDEYAANLAAVEKLFAKAVPILERLREIPDELRVLGVRLDQAGAPRPDLVGHPNRVLRPRADAIEKVAVIPPVTEGGPAYHRDRNERFFAPDPTRKIEGHLAVGSGLAAGAYDENGKPVDDRAHLRRMAG